MKNDTGFFESMRPFRYTLLTALCAVLFMSHSSTADTTNRASQVSSEPGLFVGGIGLLCVSGEKPHRTEFFLLTRDREKLGSAIF